MVYNSNDHKLGWYFDKCDYWLVTMFSMFAITVSCFDVSCVALKPQLSNNVSPPLSETQNRLGLIVLAPQRETLNANTVKQTLYTNLSMVQTARLGFEFFSTLERDKSWQEQYTH